MDRQGAGDVVRAYFRGWKEQNVRPVLSALVEDAEVIECDGNTRRGRAAIERWFAAWHAEPVNGHVIAWEISDFAFDEERVVATAQWRFTCRCWGEASSFFGASAFVLGESGIQFIREYRAEEPVHQEVG